MTTKRDYYEVLGLTRNASTDDVKKAYRSLVRKHHPDVNGGSRDSADLFKEIKEAYDVLSDTDRRRNYDQFGHDAPSAGHFEGGGIGGDIFDLFFGGRGGGSSRTGPQAGEDIRYDLQITLEEAAAGVEKTVTVERERGCQSCSGTGMRDGAAAPKCTACGGSGQVRRTQQTLLGSFASVGPCTRCRGEGVIISDPCSACRGIGRETFAQEVPLRIPAGVSTGNILQVAGGGDTGVRGGPPGDLKVVIHVAAHERFERHGRDLLSEHTVSFAQAALGAEVQAPTLTGSADLRIPAGTQPGETFRIRGEGMPDLNGRPRGDLHVVVRIPVPRQLNERQRKAIEELAASFEEEPSHPKGDGHGLRGLFEKAKEVFDGSK